MMRTNRNDEHFTDSCRWFFGFMDAPKARDLLMSLPEGSFLFRFSSTPGWYTLSVNYGQVGHWRIEAIKQGADKLLLKIDDRTYDSFHSIISTHKPGNRTMIMKI